MLSTRSEPLAQRMQQELLRYASRSPQGDVNSRTSASEGRRPLLYCVISTQRVFIQQVFSPPDDRRSQLGNHILTFWVLLGSISSVPWSWANVTRRN
jgi:hypothetical protein